MAYVGFYSVICTPARACKIRRISGRATYQNLRRKLTLRFSANNLGKNAVFQCRIDDREFLFCEFLMHIIYIHTINDKTFEGKSCHLLVALKCRETFCGLSLKVSLLQYNEILSSFLFITVKSRHLNTRATYQSRVLSAQ